MSYESLLIDVCTIERNSPALIDDYGHHADAWANHLVDEPCRLMVAGGAGNPGGREISVGAEVVIADYKLFLNDVDVTERDRAIHNSITYEIVLVSTRQNGTTEHHKELFLRTVK